MLHLPRPIIKVLHPFAAVFRDCTWEHAQVLLAGAILAPGQWTVTAAFMDHYDPDKSRWG